MTPGELHLVADDYGLSPGVSAGIRLLAEKQRLSGTGCMTLFPDWEESARHLLALGQSFEIGLHLTLTDFPSLSSGEKLPPLKQLIAGVVQGSIAPQTIAAELEAQLDRFIQATGRLPAYIDGHQHVHFLRPVRHWLTHALADVAPENRPWLRGAPALSGAPAGVWFKIAFVQRLSRGFDRQMSDSGFRICGPLAGFYNWRRSGIFERTMASLLPHLPDGAVIMCHPGVPDDVLRERDTFTDMREEELSFLGSDAFGQLLQHSNRALAQVAP